MKVKKTRYLIPLLILTIIITFCSFSCSTPGPATQAIEETAQETTEEITVEEPEEEPVEEVVADEPVEEPVDEKEAEEEEEEENVVSIGDTIPELEGYDNLSVTFLSWAESNIAVDGPYWEEDYYTFTAKPGMKFIIIFFEFKNNGIRAQETPYFNEGEITTAEKGYIYSLWEPPAGVESEEYNPRESTEEEVEKLTGSSGGYEELLPEESAKGRIVYEIPAEYTPYEATIELYSVEYLIRFNP